MAIGINPNILAQWAEDHGIMLEFIKPGKPTQDVFIECLIRRTKQKYRIFTYSELCHSQSLDRYVSYNVGLL